MASFGSIREVAPVVPTAPFYFQHGQAYRSENLSSLATGHKPMSFQGHSFCCRRRSLPATQQPDQQVGLLFSFSFVFRALGGVRWHVFMARYQ